MRPILEEIVKRTDAGERVALCVVVGSRGSTPQEKGAKMLVGRIALEKLSALAALQEVQYILPKIE